MLRAMHISALVVDSESKSPIVILKEIDGDGALPIWIGLLEASAIATELEGVKFDRPMTHDLISAFLEVLDIEIVKVEICDLKNNTYHARIHINYNSKKHLKFYLTRFATSPPLNFLSFSEYYHISF